MDSEHSRVMLVGSFGPGALEHSYARAFNALGFEVLCFDVGSIDRSYARLGLLGRLFHTFVPVEAWTRKSNRDTILAAKEFKPQILVVFGQNRMEGGALAQISSMMDLSLVFIWQDTFLNLNSARIASLPLYDLVATYSRESVSSFEQLGARRVAWVPLGADPYLHTYQGGHNEFVADVSFIGQWRPEREEALVTLLESPHDLAIKIWGPDWGRRGRSRLIKDSWQGRSLYGKDFARTIALSRISLNIIDETNYPAANMRFFEIPCAGGLQVASSCPEMDNEFRHSESIFYYHDLRELPQLAQMLLDDEKLRRNVAQTATAKIMQAHTYTHRVQHILDLLNDHS